MSTETTAQNNVCNDNNIYIATIVLAALGATTQASLYFYYRKSIFWCENNNFFVSDAISHGNKIVKFLVKYTIQILIITEIFEIVYKMVNIFYFAVGTSDPTSSNQNVSLPVYWYVLNIVTVFTSVFSVYYGCRLCHSAFKDKDTDSEWSYKYVINILLAFIEVPLLSFLQYFYVERLVINTNLTATFIATIIFKIIYVIISSITIVNILRPLLKNLKDTTCIDTIIILSILGMFISLISSLIIKLISLIIQNDKISFEYKDLVNERCPEFVLNFNDSKFTVLDYFMFWITILIWLFGCVGLGVYIFSMYFFLDESEEDDFEEEKDETKDRNSIKESIENRVSISLERRPSTKKVSQKISRISSIVQNTRRNSVRIRESKVSYMNRVTPMAVIQE